LNFKSTNVGDFSPHIIFAVSSLIKIYQPWQKHSSSTFSFMNELHQVYLINRLYQCWWFHVESNI